MKKIIISACAFALVLGMPLATNAMDISDTIRKIGATVYQKFDGINVQGGIKNSKGRVTIKDSLKSNKVGIFQGNLIVKGEVKNTLSGVPVKINDNLRVYGTSVFKSLLRAVGVRFDATDFASLDTSSFNGGEVYYKDSDDKLYLWDGTQWIDLTQQDTDTTYTNGNGIDLTGTQFSINENFAPNWTNIHDWTFPPGGGQVTIDTTSPASTPVLYIDNSMRLPPLPGAPFTCNAAADGAMYYNALGDMCVCSFPVIGSWVVVGSQFTVAGPVPCP